MGNIFQKQKTGQVIKIAKSETMDAKLSGDQNHLRSTLKSEQPESVILERQEQTQNVEQQLS